MRISIILFSILSSVSLYAQIPLLHLSSKTTVCEVGESVNFYLTISSLEGEIDLQNESTNAIDHDYFRKQITLVFNEEGRHEIGPYRLTVSGEELVSNTVMITASRSTIVYGDFENFIKIKAPEEVIAGEPFDITIQSTSKMGEPDDSVRNSLFTSQKRKFDLDHQSLEVKNTSTSTSVKYVNGKTTSEYTYKFVVIANKKGKLIVDAQSFSPPMEADIVPTEIQVKKK